ncbi:2-oxoglutarate and iron-dependent oxygenase domain-containing protein, partial [Mycobacterium tuberculosis]|nr:2-oxoglutarate and iron-dependent oxygenase domain-containing protein [Mycobacterium tuberculosis]
MFFLAFFLDFFELAFIAVPLLVKPAEAIFASDPAAVAIAQSMGFAVADGKVIDVAPFLAGAPGADAVVRAVEAACRDTGFFLVTGHGVPVATQTTLYDAARAFFDQPE